MASWQKSIRPTAKPRIGGALNKALGTTSSDFVNASLFQIQAAARSPLGGISELSMNAALAMIEAAAPKDEIEAALAVQMPALTQPPWPSLPSWMSPAQQSGELQPSDRRRLA